MATKKTTKATAKTKAKTTTPRAVKKNTKTTTKAKAKPKAKPKAVKPIQKTKAELMCENVSADIKAQATTLANAVLTMQEKIEQQIPTYKEQPLAQQVTVGTGETILRANPSVQEFRATVRDYATALNNLQDILETKKAKAETSSVDDLRKRFGVG